MVRRGFRTIAIVAAMSMMLNPSYTVLAKTGRTATVGTWKTEGSKWTFLDNAGNKLSGWIVYNGDWYYLVPEDGTLKTGWLTLNGKSYFLSTESGQFTGRLLSGWQWIDGYCYYFEEADQADYGVLFTGGKTKDGYYVDANGRWLNGAGGEPVYISGKGLSAAVSDQQVAGVSRSIPSGNAGQVAGVSRSGGSSSGGSSSGGSVSRGGSSSSSGGSTSGSGSSSSSGNATSGSTSSGNTGNTGANAGNTGANAGGNTGNNTGNTADNTGNSGNTGNTGNTASSSNLPKEEDGKPEEKPGTGDNGNTEEKPGTGDNGNTEEKPGTGDNGNTEEKPGTGESGKPEENPTPEQPEEKNVIKLVGEAKVNQDVKLYVSKDIMDSIAFVSVGFQPVLPESHRENEPSYSLDREKQILTLPKSLFKKSKTYDISIQAGGIQPFHDITIEVKDDVEVPFTAEKGEPEVLNKGILLGPTYVALNEEADLHAFRVTYVPGKGMPEKPWWTTRLKSVVVEKTLYERVNSEKEFLEKKDVYYIVPEDAEEGANTILLSDSAFEDKEKFDLMLESGNPIESVIWNMKG